MNAISEILRMLVIAAPLLLIVAAATTWAVTGILKGLHEREREQGKRKRGKNHTH
ncbi:hypothetical protein [Halomonas sp. 3H]|uniref:hypothetical protein n=1 Tax=Halomonas sp. 3H TaxID=2952527 RepID=UPI0020B7ABBF|nr:hypothetical protein [Halomonas sp. 3H]